MGIVSFLLIVGAGFTAMGGLIKLILDSKNDKSPKIGKGFFESLMDALKK